MLTAFYFLLYFLVLDCAPASASRLPNKQPVQQNRLQRENLCNPPTPHPHYFLVSQCPHTKRLTAKESHLHFAFLCCGLTLFSAWHVCNSNVFLQ